MQKHHTDVVKENNTLNLLNTVKRNGSMTIEGCCSTLHISRPTVLRILQELKDKHVIASSGVLTNTGGRSAQLYTLDPTWLFSIGIIVRRKHITVTAMSLNGTVAYYHCVHMEKDLDANLFIKYLFNELDSAVNFLKQGNKEIVGLALGMPGFIDGPNGVIVNFEQVQDCKNINIIQMIQERYGFPAILKNNTVLLTQIHAEQFLTEFPETLFVLIDDHSIGSALYNKGILVDGKRSDCANLGHVSLDRNGEKCFCGLRGCLTTTASIESMLHKYNQRCYGKTIDSIDAFIELLNHGDPVCREIVQLAGDDLGFVLANTAKMCDIKLIVLLFNKRWELPLLYQATIDSYNKYILPSVRGIVEFRQDSFSSEEAAVGAANFVFDEYIFKCNKYSSAQLTDIYLR